MSPSRPILRVGLTGGIASGKTTIAGFFSELGAYVLDADAIAHDLIEPGGSAYEEVRARFGPEILDPDGRVSRPRLAATVFRDPAARTDLEAIVHPRVTEEIDRRVAAYSAAGRSPIAVVDAALIVESGVYRTFHRLVVARCSRDAQVRRLLARGLTAQESLARLDAQAPLEAKLALAHYVIDTETTLRSTRLETARVHAELLGDYETEFGAGERDR